MFSLPSPIMSIAVSAVVRPSRALLALVGLLCAGVIFVGAMVGLNYLGDLHQAIRFLIGSTCIFLGFFALYRTIKLRKAHHIDISSDGQIRIGEHALSTTLSNSGNRGEIVRLMTGSTIWPWLLLLRLESDDQGITVIQVLPDSVQGDSFRALSVACRWIATRNTVTETNIF